MFNDETPVSHSYEEEGHRGEVAVVGAVELPHSPRLIGNYTRLRRQMLEVQP
jgi:hypothetical protein